MVRSGLGKYPICPILELSTVKQEVKRPTAAGAEDSGVGVGLELFLYKP